MSTRVVFFDYWTNGVPHFKRLAECLDRESVDYLLLHLGSWRDPSVPEQEVVSGIQAYDISGYGDSLYRAFAQLQPEVVVMLNSTYTVDRTVNRLGRLLGFKTVYMMHGIRPVGANLVESASQLDRHWGLRDRLAKVPKYVRLVVQYLSAIAREQPGDLLRPSTYRHFWELVVSPGRSFLTPAPHKDVFADRALVFAEAYRDLMVEDVGYPRERVAVVGNPELDAAFRSRERTDLPEQAAAHLRDLGVDTSRPLVTYMEDAFVEQGLAGWTEDTRLREIEEVAEACVEAGCELVVKLHPNARRDYLTSGLADVEGLHLLTESDLNLLVAGSMAVIGHTSTTLLLPIVHGRPLLVPRWSPGMENVDYYLSTGAGTGVANPQELATRLVEIREGRFDSPAHPEEFVRYFITRTDGQARGRICSEVLKLLEGERVAHEERSA